MKNDFKITIITINLNNLKGLEKTARSIPAINEIQWIVVDGKSTDGSLAFLSGCARKPDVLISENDRGIYDAMNKGIQIAGGEYINFMNAGDYFEDNFFKISLFNFENNADIVYGNTLLSDGNIVKNPNSIDFFYFFNKMINHQSVFIKKSILLKYPFNLNYKIVADWVQLFSIMKFEQPTIEYIDTVVCVYDVNGLSSRYDTEGKIEKNLFLKTYYSDWELKDLSKYSKIRVRNWFYLIDKTIDSKRLGIIFTFLNKIVIWCRI